MKLHFVASILIVLFSALTIVIAQFEPWKPQKFDPPPFNPIIRRVFGQGVDCSSKKWMNSEFCVPG